jgi:outer membrane protein assembly factor BamB
MQERPLIAGSRLIVAQPGVRTVECLDMATGRREWQTVLPEVVGVVGLAGDVLVVRTEGDVRGLDISSGATRWRSGTENIAGFPQCDENSLLLASCEAEKGSAQKQVRLTWLNATDGKPITSSAVEGLTDPDPRVGPIVSIGGKTLAFFGRGQQEVTRDVVELVPSQKADKLRASGGGG